MPHGLTRIHGRGDTHFITFSCRERGPLLATPALRDLVIDGLARAQKRYEFFVFGYVVMPEHVHALLGEPTLGTVADVIKSWKLSVTLRQKHRPFWEQRYYDFNIFTNEKRSEKLKYLHRNPIARGLSERPEDWTWSSFRHYAFGEKSSVLIESEWTARLRERTVAASPGSENPDPGHPE